MKNERGVVVLAVLFIAAFVGLLGWCVGANVFDRGLPTHHDAVAATDEYK